ncbi:MAG: TIGR03960 family B12-binding radical SAM protein [Agathobacter sp.]|mgnify:FL=1|nr:TIGR03960 family B12-binding radical SAM protein [Agathobacter sp.]
MKKLALSDEILMTIDKPARYIGNEINSVVKDTSKVDIRFAMCFPDVYEIGMSHLGIQILYDMFNKREDTWCERVYSPWPDLHEIMKEKQIPLFGLESQEPIKNFDFLAMTLQYEMCYTNILQILDLSQIPLRSKDRTEKDPLVIGGGPCSYNPEPIADFFDIFYIGEGETRYDDLFDLYKQMKKNGKSRQEMLHEIAKIPGMYVPSLYTVSYKEDGTIDTFAPIYDDVPKTIKKEIEMDLSTSVYPEKPVVPFIKATQDRIVLEIQRGCIRGCRFCQAGMIYRPNREKSVARLKELAEQMIASTGHDEISLSSLSSSDYSELEELINYLIDECGKKKINISLPSLRIDAFSLDIMQKVQDIKKSSLTFAPEAGTQRLRNVINKGLTVDNIMNGSKQAFEGGWNKVKFYFMLGLPTETEEDMRGIPELANDVAMLYYDTVPKENRKGKCQITISTSFFVPKPFTPFQWARMYPPGEYLRRAKIVNDHVKEMHNHKSIRYNWHEADVTVLEGVLARGDRRLCDTILYVYEHGGYFDAWNEYFDYDRWLEAFAATGIDPDFYTMRERDLDETLPWDFIDVGVTKEFLKREWKTALGETVTPNCRMRCSACGAKQFGGGVCYEDKN